MKKGNFEESLANSTNLSKGGGLKSLMQDKSKQTEIKENIEIKPQAMVAQQPIELKMIAPGIKIDKRRRITPKDYTTKSFNIKNDDYEFILKLQTHMRKKTGLDYTQNQALVEAIELMRKKYPEVE